MESMLATGTIKNSETGLGLMQVNYSCLLCTDFCQYYIFYIIYKST